MSACTAPPSGDARFEVYPADAGKTWLDCADEHLARVFGSTPGYIPPYLVLAAAYPWGERKFWPYKAWLKRRRAWLTCREQGLLYPEPPRRRKSRFVRPDPRQREIFDADVP